MRRSVELKGNMITAYLFCDAVCSFASALLSTQRLCRVARHACETRDSRPERINAFQLDAPAAPFMILTCLEAMTSIWSSRVQILHDIAFRSASLILFAGRYGTCRFLGNAAPRFCRITGRQTSLGRNYVTRTLRSAGTHPDQPT